MYKADSAEAVEAFQLTSEQQHLIREDHQNQKLWDEVLAHLVEGPVCKDSLKVINYIPLIYFSTLFLSIVDV